MKIWIDLTNSPHVLFFKPIIDSLRIKGHDVFLTSRDFSHTLDLLNSYNLKNTKVGSHWGRSSLLKGLGFFSRCLNLIKLIRNKEIDVAVCHQSPYCMASALIMGIKKRVYIFDNDKAKLQNLISFKTSNKIISPKILSNKYYSYSGIKESVYLHDFDANKEALVKFNLTTKSYILFRPEPWLAHYNSAKSVSLKLITNLSKNETIVVIPRDKVQREKYLKLKNKNIIVTETTEDGPSLIKHARLVIGAGGTMNRESVVLKTPVISIYQDDLLEVDKWLINKGYMFYNANPSLDFIKKVINNKSNKYYSEESQSISQICDLILK